MNKLPNLLLIALLAFSSNPTQAESLPELPLRGEATFKYMLWKVYDAALYAEDDSFNYETSRPFVLSLNYLRDFRGENIVKETRKQLERQETVSASDIDAWLEELRALLPDVAKNDTITLHVDTDSHSHFYFNEEHLGTITDKDFSEHFSAIWLSPDSMDPDFSAALSGE